MKQLIEILREQGKALREQYPDAPVIHVLPDFTEAKVDAEIARQHAGKAAEPKQDGSS
jgi:beta-galactosidase GanA